ncbi:anti-sigma factor RsbA family regulatory protein [Actinophytocola sp.]|uniref:anti-sigma factor RsbA family regulatory protein n=1 Tax=Actinophytocola sp. TaxID=1872138 RepID=UPI00389A6F70
MRTGAAAGHTGYFHEAVYYASDQELLAVVLPFVRGGVAAGEPTVVAFGERHAELVRAALPAEDASRVLFQPGGDMYARPASAIRSYRAMLADYTASGAQQIRIIGELPPTELGATWDWWVRYEAAVNHAYDEFPLWSMCAYDTRTTPPAVLADVARTHPRAAAPGDRHIPSPDYVEPTWFLRRRTPVAPDPLQLTPPPFEQKDPPPGDTRTAIQRLNETVPGGILPRDKLADLQIAATEAIANGLVHGRPPVVVRCWAGTDRIVVTVTDRGDGPIDPFAGLQAAAHAPNGGFGLWLAHQLCDHVAMDRTDGGFTLRMISGNPHHRVDTPQPTTD